MSESNIQSTFFAVLAANEKKYPQLRWIHASMNGASASSKAAAAQRKRQGQKKGIWDVCLPFRSMEGDGAWIEFKCGKGKLTPEQTEFRDHLVNEGYEYSVCRSVDEALDFVEEYLQIKLQR